MANDETEPVREDMLDFPTGWRLANEGIEHPDPRCSYVQTDGALLCDCGAIQTEWRRRVQAQVLARLGDQVQQARTRRDVTQQELAGIVGVTRSSIANLEAGRQNVPYATLAAIAAALGQTVAELVTSPMLPHELVATTHVYGRRKTINYRCPVKGCGTSGRISSIPHATADGVFELAQRAHREETSVPATEPGKEGSNS
jgi:transcriptional regulator with XRE-family HTH domain